jgi:hypothetical protein
MMEAFRLAGLDELERSVVVLGGDRHVAARLDFLQQAALAVKE